MIIGNFTQRASGAFQGDIATLGLTQEIFVAPVVPSRKGSPDYRVVLAAGSIEIGAAWQRRSAKTGKVYLSVRLDSPLFSAPVNCVLIEQEDEPDEFILVWSRKKATAEAAATE